jgi:hypothetical protein
MAALLVVAAGVAQADVVVVGKREIRGEIVDETDDTVRLKVGDGYLTFEKKNVKEIRREEEPETLIGEAHTLVKTLDARALTIFDRAIEVARKRGEKPRADALEKERNAYAIRLEKQAALERTSSPAAVSTEKTVPDDLFLLEADMDEVRVYVNSFNEGDKKSGRIGAGKLIELATRHAAEHQAR